MIHAIYVDQTRRGLLLGAGLLLGLVLAVSTTCASWQAGGVGLGFALAALVGLAQTCSA